MYGVLKKAVGGWAMAKIRTPFELHHLTVGPKAEVQLSKDDAIKYYTQMMAIRRLEAAATKLYQDRVIRGFCHLYSGQEACAVGMRAAMRDQDSIISSYRIHGLAYLMGISPAGVLAELTGKQSGCARGKGGSMHMYAPRFYGGNGIVGSQVPLGTGISFANKYKGEKSVCLTVYGDGAANQGQVFESYNMSHLLKLPVVFVCENNHYAMGTSKERGSSNQKYYKRGDILPGIWVDGMDVLAVRSAMEFAIKYVLEKGPLVVELSTYRYAGHSMSDPGVSYRPLGEVAEVRRKHDPITYFKQLCEELALLSSRELNVIRTEVQKEIDKATVLARNDAELETEHLVTDVYAKNLEPKIRNISGYDLLHIQEHIGNNK